MKIIDTIRAWQAKREALGYDPIQERRGIAESIATMLIAQGYQIQTFVFSQDGPLGGQSSRLTAVTTLPDGTTQGFNIQVYAKGVFSEDNERVRKMLDA
jgi:hypothetical protein